MVDMVGFGFRPTDDELVGHFLHHKIHGNTHLVQESINEVNICSYDPWDLRLQSKYKSGDPIWYFFSRRENKYASGNQQRRRTKSGYWKITGKPVDVENQWGKWCGVRGKIGEKRVLGFHRGKSSSSSSSSIGTKCDWMIHEYHYTLLREDKRTYVICRLEYKGDDMNMLTDNATEPIPSFVPNITHSAGSVVDQSLHGNSESFNTLFDYDSETQGQHFNMPVQESFNTFPEFYDNTHNWFSFGKINPQQEAEMLWENEIRQNYDSLVDERTFMQENCSDYRPKNPVTGVFSDDDDDSDSMIGRDTSSSTNSVGSSNGSCHNEAQEQPKKLKLQLQNKEKVMDMQRVECECKMAEDTIKKTHFTKTMVKHELIVMEEMSQRNSKWDYLKNMIIGFLLFISIIGWIILVG